MTLATRCTACSTVFRVVQDQLRVSEGWVRCGRCNQVFNAIDHLVDLSKVAPQPTPSPAPETAPLPAPHVPEETPLPEGLVESDGAVSLDVGIPVEPGSDDGERLLTADDIVEAGEGRESPAAAESPVSVRVNLPTAAPTDEEPILAVEPAEARPEMAEIHAESVPSQEPERAEAPSFVQAADRAARWQRPALRRGLLAASLLLLLGLALQVVVEYRDVVAARWTSTRPVLEALCRWSNCRIEPPRWLDALAVDSSGLVRVEGTNTYRLSVVLRNRSAMSIALPSIDLTLTDVRGGVIARRAFLASELGSDVTTIAPASELPLTAALAITERPVSGYTIEIFYP